MQGKGFCPSLGCVALQHARRCCGSTAGTVDAPTTAQGLVDPIVVRRPPPRGSGVGPLLEYNKEWAEAVKRTNATYFTELSKQQCPQYLWVGCSDSRVPANQIVGLPPGEVFVHRNVANVVARSDLNCLSVLQFAVDCLKVEHVIVCGHYGCGGVMAALEQKRLGLVDNWIMHVSDVMRRFDSVLSRVDESRKLAALCELNVIHQFNNLADTHVLRDHWAKGGGASIHGWCYGLDDGIIHPIITMKPGSKLTQLVDDAVNRVEALYRPSSEQ